MCRELMFEQLIIISHQLRIPFKNPDKSIYVRINIKIAFFSFLTNIEIVSCKKKEKKQFPVEIYDAISKKLLPEAKL